MRKILFYTFIISVVCSLPSCKNQSTQLQNSTQNQSANSLLLASAEFKKQYETATNPKQLVDVRTAEEFQAGTLSEAVNIDCKKDNFESELQKLDKNNKLFIFCQRGGRSADAHKIALKAGFQQVIELEGGYEAWQKAKQ